MEQSFLRIICHLSAKILKYVVVFLWMISNSEIGILVESCLIIRQLGAGFWWVYLDASQYKEFLF